MSKKPFNTWVYNQLCTIFDVSNHETLGKSLNLEHCLEQTTFNIISLPYPNPIAIPQGGAKRAGMKQVSVWSAIGLLAQ